ncbi:hypothetical protein GCM10022240_01700 [Microbacterium kribbense]|uniref:Uncharacterized protein n=1 Tax=Microbacterium kribbense TaxID=433645 RepID=A0ABP7G5F5_9MICO
MDDFWQFAGSYWWLIFPVMGVLGGTGNAWRRNARERHERRLEIVRAKAEIKSAQAGMRAAGRAPRVAASAAPPEPDRSEQLEKLLAAHDAVTKRWLDYELDVAKLIAFPAMSDGRQPLTAAFLRAKKVADRLRPASLKVKLSASALAEYRNAVTDFEVAFDVAERDARRLRDSTFTATERKRLDTAKQLLSMATDQAATPAERQVAYRRVREELDGLISIPDGAIEVLEKKVALQLPAGAVLPPPVAAGAVLPPPVGQGSPAAVATRDGSPPSVSAADSASAGSSASAGRSASAGEPPAADASDAARWPVPRRGSAAGPHA